MSSFETELKSIADIKTPSSHLSCIWFLLAWGSVYQNPYQHIFIFCFCKHQVRLSTFFFVCFCLHHITFKCLDDGKGICSNFPAKPVLKLRWYKWSTSRYLKECEIALWVHYLSSEHVIAVHCWAFIAENDFNVFLSHISAKICLCTECKCYACYAWNMHVCMCTWLLWSRGHAWTWMCNWTVCLWVPDQCAPTGQPTTTPTASRRMNRRRRRW